MSIEARTSSCTALVAPLAALDRTQLAVAGGKAANLGELIAAGLPVPPGFCITTEAYALAAAGAGLQETLDALAATVPDDAARLETLAAQTREALLAVAVPPGVADAVRTAYAQLVQVGGGV